MTFKGYHIVKMAFRLDGIDLSLKDKEKHNEVHIRARLCVPLL